MIIKRKISQLLLSGFFLLIISCGTKRSIEHEPNKEDFVIGSVPKMKVSDSLIFKGENSLRKNIYGQWELVASGSPMDLGNTIADLSVELVQKQEALFLY